MTEDENSSRFRVETMYNYWKAKRRNVSIGLEHEEDSSWNLAPSKVEVEISGIQLLVASISH